MKDSRKHLIEILAALACLSGIWLGILVITRLWNELDDERISTLLTFILVSSVAIILSVIILRHLIVTLRTYFRAAAGKEELTRTTDNQIEEESELPNLFRQGAFAFPGTPETERGKQEERLSTEIGTYLAESKNKSDLEQRVERLHRAIELTLRDYD